MVGGIWPLENGNGILGLNHLARADFRHQKMYNILILRSSSISEVSETGPRPASNGTFLTFELQPINFLIWTAVSPFPIIQTGGLRERHDPLTKIRLTSSVEAGCHDANRTSSAIPSQW